MRPVGVGMLGSGFIGEFHTLGLRYVPDTRVVAHADASPLRDYVIQPRPLSSKKNTGQTKEV